MDKYPLNFYKESKLPRLLSLFCILSREAYTYNRNKRRDRYETKKSPLLLLIITFIFVITGLGFTYFKHNKTTPSKNNVTKKNWLDDPYLRWSYTHMKEFTLINDVKTILIKLLASHPHCKT